MKWILALGVLAFVAVVVLLAVVRRDAGTGDGKWPFHTRTVMSDVEQVLYWRLLKVFPDHIILAQVALSRLLGVGKRRDAKAWHNRIAQKNVDFVICSKDASIVAVIELDDASHRRGSRRMADEVKDKALASAGVRILRWQAVALPDEAAMREMLEPASAKATPLPSFSATR